MTNPDIMDKFFKLRRAINLKMVNRLKALGFGPKQALALKCIIKYGPISSAKLAVLTLSDPAAISRSVDILVKHGLLKKGESRADRRAWQLILTKKGKQAAGKIREVQNSITEDIFGSLSSREQRYLMSLLDRIVEKITGDNIKKGERK